MSTMTDFDNRSPLRCPECTGPNSDLQFVGIEYQQAGNVLWQVPPQAYRRYRCARCGFERRLRLT